MLRNYDSSLALDLLAKDHDDLLQSFRTSRIDLFEAILENEVSIKTLEYSKLQIISLVRGLLEFFDERMKCRQHAFDQEHTINDNIRLCDLLIDIIDTNRFENFDSKQMHDALLKLKIFADDLDISALNTMK